MSNTNRGEPKYPQIKVKLTGRDGNAFSIIGHVGEALRKNGISVEDRNTFFDEAMSGDYSHLLATCMRWVSVS